MTSKTSESGFEIVSVGNVTEEGEIFVVIDAMGEPAEPAKEEVGANDLFRIDTSSNSKEDLLIKSPVANDGTSAAVDNGLFCLDTTPRKDSKEKPLGPRYRREYDHTEALMAEAVEEPKTESKGGSCWNCLGDHTVANCPKPRNPQEIAKNRKAFQNMQARMNHSRYHVEQTEKYSHLKPGVISDELRDALGLRSRDVPDFIYQMRIYGYPPGWIEEMKEENDGINIIDRVGLTSPTVPKMKFDLEKIIDFPGFNVPLESKYRDDWKFLNYPPMLPVHSKETLVQQLKHHSFIINSQPPAPPAASAALPTTLCPQESSDMEMSEENSMEALESQRRALLSELQESDAEEKQLTTPQKAKTKAENVTGSEPLSDTELFKSPSPGRCKLKAMGTPVSIRFSPYTALPTMDKFSLDMGEMINYENLPNSTGTFEKMKTLLTKVRSLFKKKNNG